MKFRSTRRARTAAAIVALAATTALALTGCSSSGTKNTSGSGGSTALTLWDPYPQYDTSSPWQKQVAACAKTTGVTVKVSGFDTSTLLSKALLAGQQAKSPDILLVDNPGVPTLIKSGILTDVTETGLKTTTELPNIISAGVVSGKTYGIPIGSNTIALYYNPKILKAAGVDISSVKDWASMTAALAQIKAKTPQYKGITFAGINTEEGTFQFLPWFWGSGANLTNIDSADAVSAAQLISGWVKAGYAPNSVIQDNQGTSWQEMLAGKTAFAENGTWFQPDATKNGWGVISIPAKNGGPAPAPTGGEFFTIPVQKDSSTYKPSAALINCLTSDKNIVATAQSVGYIATTTNGITEQAKQYPVLAKWADQVRVAKARTGDNLATNYPIISKQIWTALQASMTGSQSPDAAFKAGQAAAAQGVAANK